MKCDKYQTGNRSKRIVTATNSKEEKMTFHNESVTDSQEENKPPQRRKNKV